MCFISEVHDFVLLEAPRGSLDPPIVDEDVYKQQEYVLMGTSARSQVDPVSARHGSVLTTRPDGRGFIRGDTPSIMGDSGGGCFDAVTGCLFAINVQTTPEGAALLPISIPYATACNLGLGPPALLD